MSDLASYAAFDLASDAAFYAAFDLAFYAAFDLAFCFLFWTNSQHLWLYWFGGYRISVLQQDPVFYSIIRALQQNSVFYSLK